MDGIIRELSATDPMRDYGVTHRIYGGSLAGGITLNGSYGTKDASGKFVVDTKLNGWQRALDGPEIIEMLLWAGHTQAEIDAALADGTFMDSLVVPGLKHLGPFLDHDDRWGGV